MKKIIILLLLVHQCSVIYSYELSKRINFGNSLSYFKIYDGNKEIAQIYFLDPKDKFFFLSVESHPTVFSNLVSGIDTVATLKNINPIYAILADFSKPIKVSNRISLSYIWNSLGVLMFAPDYLKKVRILNPDDSSQRFFMETEINDKELYSLIILNKNTEAKVVKTIIRETKGLSLRKFKLYSILNFPLALMTFGDKNTIVYESHKNIKKYSCLFVNGE